MATTVTHIVDTDSGAGYDYDSLFDWEAGEQGDLTGVRDEIAAADCRCTNGTADTTGFTIAGWTISETQYINIYGNVSYRHAGVWNDAKYRISTGSSTSINIQASYTRISYLQFTVTGGCDCIVAPTGAITGIRIFNNISKCVSSTGSEFIYINNNNASGWKIYNNVIYDHANAGIYLASGSSVVVYNNTISGCTTGIKSSIANGIIAINNILNACTTGATGTFAAGTDYNATDDASIGYTVTGEGNTNDHVSHTFTFVSATNFHLQSSDVGAIDLGVSNPGSGLFSDDIDGVARSGTWDIGADEYVSGITNYSLSCEGGSYAVTGTATAPKLARKLAIGAGSIEVTGQAVSPLLMRKLAIGAGSYELTGAAVGFSRTYKIPIGVGEYALDGQVASLKIARKIVPGAGSYELTGQVASLIRGLKIPVASGSYEVTGQVVSLEIARKMVPVAGSYVLTGQSVNLMKGFSLPAGAGSYVITGQALSLLLGRLVSTGAGSYSLTGADVTLTFTAAVAGQGIYVHILRRRRRS